MKKVRIFRAWFSHGSGAILALKTFGIITEEAFFIFEICFVTFEEPLILCGTIQTVSYQELVLERVLKVVCMALRGEETILYLKELV